MTTEDKAIIKENYKEVLEVLETGNPSQKWQINRIAKDFLSLFEMEKEKIRLNPVFIPEVGDYNGIAELK